MSAGLNAVNVTEQTKHIIHCWIVNLHKRLNDVEMKSMRRQYVAATSVPRHYDDNQANISSQQETNIGKEVIISAFLCKTVTSVTHIG